MAIEIIFSVADDTQSVDWDSIDLARLVNQAVTVETLTSSAFKGFFPEGEVVFPLNSTGFATLAGPFPEKLDVAQGIDPQAIEDWARVARTVNLEAAFFSNIDNEFIEIRFIDVEISLERFASLTLPEFMEESFGLAPNLDPGLASISIELSDGINNFTASSGDDWVEGGKSNDVIFLGEGSNLAFGNAGDDTITGGSGIDEISGQTGNDVLIGLGGSDTLVGDEGDDSILGGGGKDFIFGGSGIDDLEGHAGNDVIHGNRGNDVIDGGNGDDELFGDQNRDVIDGGAGRDEILGGTGNDTLRGGDNFDRIFGGSDNDKLFGGKGGDTLEGDAGRDRLIGNNGSDALDGGAGRDVLKGGIGDDTFFASKGSDRMLGGSGADSFVYFEALTGRDIIRDYELSEDMTLLFEIQQVNFSSGELFRDYVRDNTVFTSRGAEVVLPVGKKVIYEDIQSNQQAEFFATFDLF